jgi:hypothetical protein
MYKLSVFNHFEQELQKMCPEKSVRLYDLYVHMWRCNLDMSEYLVSAGFYIFLHMHISNILQSGDTSKCLNKLLRFNCVHYIYCAFNQRDQRGVAPA